jgi:hypothetical protein
VIGAIARRYSGSDRCALADQCPSMGNSRIDWLTEHETLVTREPAGEWIALV